MLQEIAPLFQKIETVSKEEKKEELPHSDVIGIEDFAKVKLVVGTIEQCVQIEQSDKLYKLQVNFGDKGKRQVLSGVRKSFAPTELIGKQAIFVFNLKPRIMLGLESHGMMLLAEDEVGKLTLSTVARAVPDGTLLR